MSLQRLLSPVVDVRREEAATVLLMFAYSFLAMTAYNIVQPITRSRFITSLGSDNIPYVLLVSAFIVGLLMQGYSRLGSLLPARWVIPATQGAMVGLLVLFWVAFATGPQWVDVGFYLFGQIYGILLISQFWTLANLVYNPRAAKRIFGFIGGGATAGGALGASIVAFFAEYVGNRQLVLVSAVALAVCAAVVVTIVKRSQNVEFSGIERAGEEKGVGGAEAFRMLRESRHLQVIALTIGLMSVGAGMLDQQLNMAAEASKGRGATDAISSVLGQVQVYVSMIGFFVQVWLTSRIHRLLGVGFALLILPIALGGSAVLILLTGGLWSVMFARTLDKSLRYTVDKTSREILFLPLSAEIKQKAKPFVDVTVDRFGRAASALLLLLLIKPWALNLSWVQISFASLAVMGLWIAVAIKAKNGYIAAFKQSIERRDLAPAEVRLDAADLSTVETLVQELAHPDPDRVVYAIDVLESLDKRSLVTPLLLNHESPKVRRRALAALGAARSDIAVRWLPHVRRMLGDADAGVRAGAISALGSINNEDAAALARPMLADADLRIRATAAAALAGSPHEADVDAAETALLGIIGDTSDAARHSRRDVAAAIRQISNPRFRRLLIPLLYDPAPEVADEAMESVRAVGTQDFLFVPTLVALLRQRRLKGQARAVLVSYGEPVVSALAHFMRDPDEDVWVRRHIPATLAQIPGQGTVDVLIGALEEPDGFLRFKAVAALEKLRRDAEGLVFARDPIENLVLAQGRNFFNYLSLHDNLFGKKRLPPGSLLERAILEKMERSRNRIFLLLALLYPWKDIETARWTLEHGDARSRASASEYLDNILSTQLRKRIMPVIEDLPRDEKVRRGNVLLKTRPRDMEETLLQLINDDDQVVAAAAIDVVRQQKHWSLGDDIEHVLAHRDARDWYVFEASSWALAERRMSADRRRELWNEPLPAVELAERLRHLPLFASVSVDELFRVAGASRQARHEPGATLLQEGSVPDTVHILLDGRVSCAGRDGGQNVLDAPAAIGFAEALPGTPLRDTYRTMERVVTLALNTEELRTLLADNGDLVSGLVATLAAGTDDEKRPVHSTRYGAELEALADSGLTAVEKILALQRIPLFAKVSAEEMRQLALIARTVAMEAGKPLFTASGPSSLWLVLSGEVALHDGPGDPVVIARAGDIIGAYGALAGKELGLSGDVQRSGTALQIKGDDLFLVLGERPEMLRQFFSGLFAAIRAQKQRALQTA